LEGLTEALSRGFHPGVYRCVLSGQVNTGQEYKKIGLDKLGESYRLEKYTQTQVFHEHLGFGEAVAFLKAALEGGFRQYNSWDGEWEYSIRITKKGKTLYTRSRAGEGAPKPEASHNREKQYILRQGTSIPPLIDMGVFTKEGKVAAAMQGKYRQINRFIEIIDDEVGKLDPKKPMHIIDFGCGKSYLTFILYHYLTEIKKLSVSMTGLDLKRDVIEKCNTAARKNGYEDLSFQVGDIGGYDHSGPLDMVVTLHACDTATDYALYNAIRWGADMIFSVPCCQHEANAQINSEDFAILTRYGLIKERVASLMTDAIRANLLEACGYRVQLIEIVAFDHTPKNIMIRAAKRPGGNRKKALAEVDALCGEFGLDLTLYRLLREGGFLLA
jgi:SAM-dependent methyltransferase